jgi:hypothetical protein
MRFPYTEVASGIFRPLVSVLAYAPARTVPLDGLLDTGSDRILLPFRVAADLGIDPGPSPRTVILRSATGQDLVCQIAQLILELRRDATRVCWLAEVAVAPQPLRVVHWGIQGFLEYFTADFDGPNRWVILKAGGNLPAAAPPP